MARSKFNIDRDGSKFVRLWQTAACIADVARAMDMGFHATRQTAVRLRIKGVPLRLYRCRKPDYKKLAKEAGAAK